VAAPLKLKRQIPAASRPKNLASVSKLPIASVLVDTPVSHLEGIYDYWIPSSMDELITSGTKVIVPFGNVNADGLVISRSQNASSAGKLKEIVDVTSPSSMVSAQMLEHIELVRNRFGGSFWNLLKQSIPKRVVKAEKLTQVSEAEAFKHTNDDLQDLIGRADFGMLNSNKRLKWAVNLPIATDAAMFVAKIVLTRAKFNQVLLLVPDDKDIRLIKKQIDSLSKVDVVELSSNLDSSTRYRNFLQTCFGSPKIIIANRSGAFTNLQNDSTVIVLNDLDASHYEQHSPGWNSRDVTLMRGKNTSFIFVSASHSLEIARLIDIGWLEHKIYKSKSEIRIVASDSNHSFISMIKKSLSSGSVLVTVSEKGYANVFLCSKCRNSAKCDCGGKLQIKSSNSRPECYLCSKKVSDWHCNYCGDTRPYVISKGIDRNAEEIGKANPNIPIYVSSGTKQIEDLPDGHCIVLATAGSEPNGAYSAVVMLDGESIFNRPTLRAEEIARLSWFSNLSKISIKSEVFVSLPNNHPVVQSMLKGSSSYGIKRELENREAAKLPPYYRVASVSGSKAEISKFADNLIATKKYEITGPVEINHLESRLLIRVASSGGSDLVDLLDDVVKIQGIKGKKIFRVRLDPYDL
jgi:primosomal protein N' (replication factor Y) (superfamily II helicase)